MENTKRPVIARISELVDPTKHNLEGIFEIDEGSSFFLSKGTTPKAIKILDGRKSMREGLTGVEDPGKVKLHHKLYVYRDQSTGQLQGILSLEWEDSDSTTAGTVVEGITEDQLKLLRAGK